jgi:hypothetical protein
MLKRKFKRKSLTLDVHIDKIPCQIEVETYPEEREYLYYPYSPERWELLEIYDRKGYSAPWLAKKLEIDYIQEKFCEEVNEILKEYFSEVK